MTFKERLKKEHQNNVKCFGKKPTIIIYVWICLLVIMAAVLAIINLLCSDDKIAIAFSFIASLIGVSGIIYIVVISRFEKK